MVYEKELEESVKNSLARTWSHLVDLSNGKKKLGGGGCRSQVVKLRRTVKNQKDIEKKEKEGGRNSSPGDQSGAEIPQSLAELSFFSRWLFQGNVFLCG